MRKIIVEILSDNDEDSQFILDTMVEGAVNVSNYDPSFNGTIQVIRAETVNTDEEMDE